MSEQPDIPRADEPIPAGTAKESFFQRSATQTAIVVTVGLGLMLLRGVVMGEDVSREALFVSIEAAVWAWLGAIGIHRIGPSGFRWK